MSGAFRLWLLFIGLGLLRCGTAEKADRQGETKTLQDSDGDSWTAPQDCDDQQAQTHPGAEEQCNGQDDNCNGLTDEAAAGLWVDVDGDGWGGPPARSCSDGALVQRGGDCDDHDPHSFPGAEETPCDQVDQDCGAELPERFWSPGRGVWSGWRQAEDRLVSGDTLYLCPGDVQLQVELGGDLELTIDGQDQSRLAGDEGDSYIHAMGMTSLRLVRLAIDAGTAAVEWSSQGQLTVEDVQVSGEGGSPSFAVFYQLDGSGSLEVRRLMVSDLSCEHDCAAIDWRDGQVLVEDSTFVDLSTGGRGAAIRHRSTSASILGALLVRGSTFQGNRALLGPDIYVEAVEGEGLFELSVEDSSLSESQAEMDGGSTYVTFREGSARLQGLSYASTAAGGSGGAVYVALERGEVAVSALNAVDCTAELDGGALHFEPEVDLDLNLLDLSITGGKAGWRGGAISVAGAAQTDLLSRELSLSDSMAWQGAGLSLAPSADGEVRGQMDGLTLSRLQAGEGSGAMHVGPGVWLEVDGVESVDNSPVDVVCMDGEASIGEGRLQVVDGYCGPLSD